MAQKHPFTALVSRGGALLFHIYMQKERKDAKKKKKTNMHYAQRYPSTESKRNWQIGRSAYNYMNNPTSDPLTLVGSMRQSIC
jgi:hypothetical protein